MTLGTCPECGELAEIQPWGTAESTHGPTKHVKIHCIIGHEFTMPEYMIEGWGV